MARKPMAPAGLDRTASIPRPPARVMPRPASQPEAPVPSSHPADSAAEVSSAPLPAAQPQPTAVVAPRQRARGYADDISVPITLSLPGPLVDWVRTTRKIDQTVADVVLVAISASIETLPDRIAELRDSKGRKEGIFTLSAPKSESVIATLQMHTRSSNVTEIDRLVSKTGAENRSQLVRAALELVSQRS